MNVLELLQDLNVPYKTEGHEHCRPGWAQLDCPFCTPGAQHWRLGVNLNHGYANCWACGSHSLPSTLAELGVLPYGKAKDFVRQLDRGYLPKELAPGRLELPKGLGPLLPPHRKYLKSRGFSPRELERLWGVQGIGLQARLAWRVFIPIQHRGKTVSWTTRGLTDQEPRYVSAGLQQEAMPRKHLLFGQDFARHAIVVTEGPFDAIRIGPGAVATLGVAYSRAQVRKMANFPVRVICFDSDPTAQQRARELCRTLEPYPGQTVNVCLDSKDPGSASAKEIRVLRKHFLD